MEVDPVGRVTSAKGGAAVAVTLPTWPPGGRMVQTIRKAQAGQCDVPVRAEGGLPGGGREENVAPCVPPHAIVVGGALLRSCQVEQVSERGWIGKTECPARE